MDEDPPGREPPGHVLRWRAMSTKEPDAPNTPLPQRPGMPGGAAALPEGSLSKPFLGPQGDENRDPPPNAPAPVSPTATVENEE